jgi:predicted MFS family arabinose efflux permease
VAGPALAGAVIAIAGVAACFALNTLSFAAMLVALAGMDTRALRRPPVAGRGPGKIRAALREVRRRPELRIPLVMMAVVGTLSFNFQVLLPLFARFTWEGSATTYAALTAAMGIGSVAGALVAGARGRVTSQLLVSAAALFGIAQLAAAAAPTVEMQALALVPLGAASVTFAAGVNSSLQLAAAGELRGRVMALYSVVFLGSTPIGAPAIGWLAEHAGPRAGLVVGAVAALGTALYARVAFRRAASSEPPAARPDCEHSAPPARSPSPRSPEDGERADRPLGGQVDQAALAKRARRQEEHRLRGDRPLDRRLERLEVARRGE